MSKSRYLLRATVRLDPASWAWLAVQEDGISETLRHAIDMTSQEQESTYATNHQIRRGDRVTTGNDANGKSLPR